MVTQLTLCVCLIRLAAAAATTGRPAAPPQPAHPAPSSSGRARSHAPSELKAQMSERDMSDVEESDNSGGSAKGASAHSDRKDSSAQLVASFESDAAIQSLRPALRASLRPAVESLQTTIHSEMVAHTLTLYRYTRLQQKLMAAKKWTRIRSARQLNSWIGAAYGEHGQELVARIRHDASSMSLTLRAPRDAIVTLTQDAIVTRRTPSPFSS